MNERPILQDWPTDAERILLDSACIDVPPSASKRRVLAAVGLAAAATTTASAGGAAAASATGVFLLKCVAVGAMGGLVASAALEHVYPTTQPDAAKMASTYLVGPAVPVGVGTHAHSENLPSESIAAPDPAPSAAARDVSAPPRDSTPSKGTTAPPGRTSQRELQPEKPATPTATTYVPTLADEVATLDGARLALASGQPAQALTALDSYDRKYTQPDLRPEADLLRVEVLLALGQVAAARNLAERLLAEQPDSAYAQRVRSLIEHAVAADR